MLVGVDVRQVRRQIATFTSTFPRLPFESASWIAPCTASAIAVWSTCSRIGRTKSSTSCDDGVRHLGFADDVGQHHLRVGGIGNLAAQQTGHDLDAGERILDLVGDHGGHLSNRCKTIAQTLALLELFNAGQVLEEHGRPDHVAIVGADERERVADHLVRGLEPHLDAVRQMVQIERTGEHADDVRVIAKDGGIG